jgi:GNAT superfamily N-acetyltransferase
MSSTVKLVRPDKSHLPALSKIMFDAFKGIAERHAFESDVPTIDICQFAMTSFVTRPDMYGVVAVDESGNVVGHNFLQLSDEVAGVGPICVEPGIQSKGVGRMLMTDVIEHALKNHGPKVRLVQEAYNMTSLSLYASLGFVVREPLALVTYKPAEKDDPTVRALGPDDVDACDALYQKRCKMSRKNELTAMVRVGPSFGCVPHGKFVGGRCVGVQIPGFFGFGAAETPKDLLDLAQGAARNLPEPMHRFLLPMRQGELFAGALARGFRCLKTLNLMSIGPYDDPSGAWNPSIAF